MITISTSTNCQSRPRCWRAAVLATVLATLSAGHQACAENVDINSLICVVDPASCRAPVPKKPSRVTAKPVYVDTSAGTMTPIPRYAAGADDKNFVNDCLISGLKAVASDVAAHMVRTSCENKARALKQDRNVKYADIYGPTASEGEVEVIPLRKGIGDDRLQLKNISGRHDMAVTYLSVNIAYKTKEGACLGESMRFAYKVSVPPMKSVELLIPHFSPAASPGVCATVVEVRGKPMSWTESWQSATAFGGTSPLKEDPFP